MNLLQLTEEGNDSYVVIENLHGSRNIVVLFPMTRSKDMSLPRWQKLISTVNNSKVTALVLIDKTPQFQASDYFKENEKEIQSNIFIVQRPRVEPIHDSQSRIRLTDGLWIIQLHDDDDWEGVLKIPDEATENSIVKTSFTILGDGLGTDVVDPMWPDCRSIFSLLPAKVWNRFADLISAQGGHVAGSIDSSLNLAVSLIVPRFFSSDFRYFYDNRHWESKKLSKEHLIQLTKEDGWGKFATVEISLVSRAIDGIASLIFFSDLYPSLEVELQLQRWIAVTKPHDLRVFLNRFEMFFLKLLVEMLRNHSQPYLRGLKESLNASILYKGILLSTWNASTIADYISIVETLVQVKFLAKLQPRFNFWRTQLMKYPK